MMRANTTIRPATPDDAPALGRLGALLVRAHHALDPERFLMATADTEPTYGAYLVEQLDRSDVIVLVAEQAGDVIGYAYATLEGIDYMALRGPAGIVHDLVVDVGHRGEGSGRRLLSAALAMLLDKGAPQVVLSAAARNQAAQRLFTGHGFRPTLIEMHWTPAQPVLIPLGQGQASPTD